MVTIKVPVGVPSVSTQCLDLLRVQEPFRRGASLRLPPRKLTLVEARTTVWVVTRKVLGPLGRVLFSDEGGFTFSEAPFEGTLHEDLKGASPSEGFKGASPSKEEAWRLEGGFKGASRGLQGGFKGA